MVLNVFQANGQATCHSIFFAMIDLSRLTPFINPVIFSHDIY